MSKAKKELVELYPFLYGKPKDEHDEKGALIESVRQKALDSVNVKQQFFEKNAEEIVEIAYVMAKIFSGGNRLFSMGNGGSSCDAAHFAVEFLHPVTTGRPALPVINLVMDSAMLTAVGNDVGFENIFVRQLDALGKNEDGLVGFSTSGNSRNLMEGYRKAKELGLTTFGITGGDGGEMKTSADVDYCLVVESQSIHRVQETHVAAYHVLWDLVHTRLADCRGKLGSMEGK